MNLLIEKKDELKQLKNKYQKKLFIIDNELIRIENEMTKFSEDQLVNSLNLSKDQSKIVNAIDDNILVIACPGAGKTHAIISRYINLISIPIQSDIYILPESIILKTFTKKTGQEMLHRLQNKIPNKLPYHVGSLHSLSYKILQKYNNINYIVLDENESKEILIDEINLFFKKDELKNINEEDKKFIKNTIIKNNIIDKISTSYPLNFKSILKKHNLIKYYSIIYIIYKNFIKKKKNENLIDFNDLMILFCEFMKSNKSLEFRNSIKYVFFDEYQDINSIQEYILNIFKEKSKIMVVGDDAQSIYSFRGCSIKYINNFIGTKYFLTENFRSTPAIVNFCQNIIEKNIKQYDKKVKSVQNEYGSKPLINGFDSIIDQYKWIVSDIIDKKNNGILLSNMVILARTNKSLTYIETELIKNKISIIKQSGLTLLNQYHIKDFLAFIIITYNSKSSIHWKRVLSLHKSFNTTTANDIVNSSINIYDKICELSNTIPDLLNLVNLINKVKKINNDNEKSKLIISYLEKLWSIPSKIEENKKDILYLLYYLKNSNNSGLIDFIRDIYLNQEIETIHDNSLYCSTIHGAKGLEWDYVYIIDVNNTDFPNIQNDYYIEQLENMEEERRLFYVACSRAKKYLTITYNNNIMSPFIRELDEKLYNGLNIIKYNIFDSIDNILLNNGYKYINKLFENLEIKEKKIHSELEIPLSIAKIKKKFIINNYIKLLIYKMIQNNFSTKLSKIKLKYTGDEINNKSYTEYIDKSIHWENLLNQIFNLIKNNDKMYKNFLINNILFYKELELGIKKIIDYFKPKNILNEYDIFYDNLKCEIDLLFNGTCHKDNNLTTQDYITDGILIIIKISSSEICCLKNLCDAFKTCYLLEKKKNKINKIIFYNVELGKINIINTSFFNSLNIFNDFYTNFYKKN
jgi:DNA helicase-2/ATP-dependent DNA helicase PcrA